MDQGFGLLAHSPYTGLTYAVDVSDADAVSQWLDNQRSEPPADHYQYSVGAGWTVPHGKSRQHMPQLLPDPGYMAHITHAAPAHSHQLAYHRTLPPRL
jgi:hypothetical protein